MFLDGSFLHIEHLDSANILIYTAASAAKDIDRITEHAAAMTLPRIFQIWLRLPLLDVVHFFLTNFQAEDFFRRTACAGASWEYSFRVFVISYGEVHDRIFKRRKQLFFHRESIGRMLVSVDIDAHLRVWVWECYNRLPHLDISYVTESYFSVSLALADITGFFVKDEDCSQVKIFRRPNEIKVMSLVLVTAALYIFLYRSGRLNFFFLYRSGRLNFFFLYHSGRLNFFFLYCSGRLLFILLKILLRFGGQVVIKIKILLKRIFLLLLNYSSRCLSPWLLSFLLLFFILRILVILWISL